MPHDRVVYLDSQGKQIARIIRPDGVFTIQDTGSRYRWRFLLELDRGTESDTRIGDEKALAGLGMA